MSYFTQSTYTVVSGNIVYAADLNNPLLALQTSFDNLVSDIRTGTDLKYNADTGVVNAYALNLDPAITEYTLGQEIWLRAANTNTGASTINVNSLGTKEIRRFGLQSLEAGDIQANYFLNLKYDGTYFQIVSTAGNLTTSAAASASASAASAVESASSATAAASSALDAAVSAALANSVPAGSIMAFVGGYFTDGSNGGFVDVLGNTVAAVNALLNATNWYVCDGSALNYGSGIFSAAGRFLPNLTDDRFIMGDTTAGYGAGIGSNTNSHTHTTGSETAPLPIHDHVVSNTFLYTSSAWKIPVTASGAGATATNITTSQAGTGGTHNHGPTTGQTGTENRPQFLSCIYIMRVI